MNGHPLARNLINEVAFFKKLSPPQINAIKGDLNLCALEKGTHAFHRGDEAHHVYIILDGWIKLYKDTPEGNEVVLDLLTRDQMFGETAILTANTYNFNAQAVEDSRIISIPAAAMQKLTRHNPDIMIQMMQSFTEYSSRLQLENEHLSFMSAPQRVGCLLLQLVDGSAGMNTQEVFLPYEKSLAAARLGMKAETFSRALSHLKEVGITVNGNKLSIESIDELVDFVCSDCSAYNTDCRFSSVHHCTQKEREQCHLKNRKS